MALSAHAGLRAWAVRDAEKTPLSSRQKIEVVFQNGVRNAQKRNDVYGQVRALQKALEEIREIGERSPGRTAFLDKNVQKRIKQLKRMIAKETPSETL